MSNTTNTDNAASELGFQPGDIVQEWLWDDDVDGHIRDSIEALTGEDLVDKERSEERRVGKECTS